MTGDKRLTGIFLGAAAAAFSLTMTLNTASAMPAAASTVSAAQSGLSQVEKAQFGPRFRGPGRRGRGWRGGRGRRVCFWRFGRRVCVFR